MADFDFVALEAELAKFYKKERARLLADAIVEADDTVDVAGLEKYLKVKPYRPTDAEVIETYDDMDFCDDFETFCEYYCLPFADKGREGGGALLEMYIDKLRGRVAERRDAAKAK